MNDVDSLRRCGECGCSFSYETTAKAVGATHWLVAFHCPNCRAEWSRLLDERALTQVDHAVDEDMRVLVGELKILEQVAMADEIERFAAALEAGAILPMDF